MATLRVLSKYYKLNNFSKILHKNNCLFISTRKFSVKNDENKKNHYDIIIAGGGMVGTSCALAIAKDAWLSSKRVLLLEGGPPFKENISEQFSNRVSALSRRSCDLLTKLGAWENLYRLQHINHMQVWDACSDALITFNDNDFENIAYIVENDVILQSLNKSLESNSNVSVLTNSKIKYIELYDHTNNLNAIELSSGEKYSCDLLIGADGANSQVRRQMGVQYLNWSYNQLGVVATLELAEEQDNRTAWQRFLPTGPIALLPLSQKYSSLVWSTTPDSAKQLLALEPADFVNRLNESLICEYPRNRIVDTVQSCLNTTLRNTFGTAGAAIQIPPEIKDIVPNSRAAFPLGFGHSVNYIKPGVVLIGDAAHRVHPLAGQGVNLGFADVDTLINILGEATYRGDEINDLNNLQDYESQRQRENVPTMLAIDGLHRLYNTDLTPIVLLRSMGLQLTHALTPLKKLLMQRAAGAAY